MRKIFLSLAIFVMAACLNAQTNQYFWYQGNLIMGNPIAQIDSVTFGNEDTDSILIYLPRTSTNTIEIHDTVYITIHDTVRIKEFYAISEGAIDGVFSVSSTKKVHFSKGNLQYQASTSTWRFAEKQYDYIGNGNANISPTYYDWIDLFGWGTGNNPTLTSTDYSDYSTFTDWGLNAISNGGNENNLWRTLTKNEWYYILYTRSQATSLWGFGTVNGVNGMILLPDNYELPIGASFTPIVNKVSIDEYGCFNSFNNPDEDSYYLHNTYTLEQWGIMESAGAIFLPAAGNRNTGNIDYIGTRGNYWSSSPHADWCSIAVCFRPDYFHPQNWNDCNLHFGFSVRLVQDVE